MDRYLNDNSGMTPRNFDHLFTRIRDEEENRLGKKLKYNYKCSFLEIYNEQVIDLLEPSSTNLRGAANRKMAATNMNSESSRSHSVFTCVIESRWEMDSTTHLRFGRLNLVDLAGLERQKGSGAGGEHSKEAANINKSLSTLSLVIMTLVNLAHGKHRLIGVSHTMILDSHFCFSLPMKL